MTVPRREIVDEKVVGVYHCISRCVRRAYLCGYDAAQGRSFEHRREWVRGRLAFLVRIFAVDLIAYALMSNHVHTLLKNRPDIAAAWEPQEVARRWRTLFPLRRGLAEPSEPSEEEIAAIADNPQLVALYRARLASISWLHRCLCENIARRANQEDDCTGRFWEGRFKSQRVQEISGVVACMAYIDLNPVRAGIATTPEQSDFTSIQDRLRARRLGRAHLSTPKIATIEEITQGRVRTDEYLQLIHETAQLIRQQGVKVTVGSAIRLLLQRVEIRSDTWLDTARHLRPNFRRAIGPVEALSLFARRAGKQWLHGLSSARKAFL